MKKAIAIFCVLVSLTALANKPLKIQVLDENNEPLTGVKLVEVNEKSILFTDFEGVSELANVDNTKIFKVEYLGYESGFIKVSPKSDEEIKIVLRKK